MILKLTLAWLASYLIVVGYEFIHHRYLKGRDLSEIAKAVREVVLMLSGIFYYTASAFAGVFIMLYLLPPNTLSAGKIEAVVGIIAGLWVLGIFLQLSLNAVRWLQGVPAQKLVFFNRQILRFGRRKD